MNGLTSTSWVRMQASLWPSRSAATPKTMGHSRKAWTRHVEVSKPLRRLALIVFPSLAMATAASAAENHHAYPGATCQPAHNTDPILREEEGNMFNTGTTVQTWICPVVKFVREARDPEYAQIVAFVREGTAADVSCTFQSRADVGGSDQVGTPRTISSPANPNLQIMQFGVGEPRDEPNVDVGVEEGYYYFLCGVSGTTDPSNPDAGIISYFVNENVNEN